MVAALDHDVRIGADHGELARVHLVDQLDVVLRRLAGVVVEAEQTTKLAHSIGASSTSSPRRLAGRARADMKTRSAGALGDQRASHVTRADDRIIGLARTLSVSMKLCTKSPGRGAL